MPEDFEAKRARRAERLRQRAAKKQAEGEARVEKAHRMAEVIPFGQPILVGHHSEKRDRNYRDRIHNNFAKGYEALSQVDTLKARAEACENNAAIFSDDPKAEEKLEERIKTLEERQKAMTQANRLIRKNDREGLLAMGFTETRVEQLFKPDFCGRIGFADYELSNNRANIRRLKLRLQTVEAHKEDESTTFEFGRIKVVDNVEENRVQVVFPGKPSKAVCQEMRHSGFVFSYENMAWQRHRNSWALTIAKDLALKFSKE